jgi:hypothetical protein
VKRLVWLGTGILALAILSWWTVVRLVPRWRARELTPVMESYMQAAARGDTAALGRLSADSEPTQWGMAVHRGAPAFATEASARLRPWFVERHGDQASAGFKLRREISDPRCEFRPLRQVQARFVHQGGEWRLVWVGTDIC